ncbi:acyl-CoA dehydrogenase family protein [Kerstersia similis]|uniref:acyl-CoA dehydrogenase family protein n=1 Tax=Kerstersia similis TaxID=206505 RepID=UPI0039F0578A
MWEYDPPLRDMRFVIDNVLQAPASWASMPAFADLDADTAAQVLQEAGRFAKEVLLPINSPADLQGCRWQDGAVSTPDGYRDAYHAFCEGGWPALACDPAWDGQGLPQLLNAAFYEMLAGCNHAWAMYPGLAHGAYECLKAHATPELQETYLRKIVSGEYLATMGLTESHAGSDLGLLRTRAQAVGEMGPGAEVRISGNKIFISGGEQDLTKNIVHLVLARLPDAPAGSRGLSLFLVPHILPDGTRNAVRCDGIEKKMGIKGSATCVLSLEAATGWLIGEPNRGLNAMFVMMNAARLQVGMQGLGHLELSSQNALRYAQERQQSRARLRPEGTPAGAADPIALHPAMRRTLLSLKAMTEGLRVLSYWTGVQLDESEQHPDEARRRHAGARVALLTPIVKAYLTHHGHYGANAALQIWGGHGYVHEYGIEQSVRDSRIAMIYEGTNEIQAIDLLQRKALTPEGVPSAALLDLLAELRADADAAAALPSLAAHAANLHQSIQAFEDSTRALAAGAAQDPEWPLRVADDYLHAAGLLLMGWAWLRSARTVLALSATEQADPWYAAKLDTCRYGLEWLLPELALRLRLVGAQQAALPWLPAL